MTAQNPPIFIQAGSHPAEDVRQWLKALSTEGVLSDTELLVAEAGTPDMTVDVSGGGVFIAGTETTYQGIYFAENRGTTNVAVASSDATNPRIDLVVARIKDAAYSGAANTFSIEVVTGTPAASPAQPTTPDNSLLLATISVVALSTTVTTAVITDTRTVTRSLGPDGTKLLPSYSFADDPNTGVYSKAADTIGFTAGGADVVRVDGSYLRGNVNYTPAMPGTTAGTAAAPAYGFVNDSDTGMYRSAANEISFATSGTDRLTIDSAGAVGIGTTTPSTALEVADSNPATVTLKGTGSVVSAGDEVQAIDFYQSDASGGAGVSARIVGVGNNSSGAQNLTFHTGQAGAASVAERVRIDSNGKVGIGTTSPVNTLSVGESGNLSSFNVYATKGVDSFTVSTNVVKSENIRQLTTASAASVFINATTGIMYRSTSAAKYKTDVETMDDEFADAILDLRPVWYKSLGDHDPDSWGYWGLIAEEVAEVDPRIVHWGTPDNYEVVKDENGETVPPAVGDMTEAEGVQYERIVPHLINIAARQRDQIAALEARLDAAGI